MFNRLVNISYVSKSELMLKQRFCEDRVSIVFVSGIYRPGTDREWKIPAHQ